MLVMMVTIIGFVLLACGTSSALAGSGGEPPTCDPGQHVAGGMCVSDDTPALDCAAGTHIVGTDCVPDVPTCPAGWHTDGGMCVEGDPTCGPGTHVEGGRCDADLPAPCAPATHRVGDSCVANDPTCDEGFSFDGNECIADSEDDTDSTSDGSTDSGDGTTDSSDGTSSGTSTDGSTSTDGDTGTTTGTTGTTEGDPANATGTSHLPGAPGGVLGKHLASSPLLNASGMVAYDGHGPLPTTGVNADSAFEMLLGAGCLLIGMGSLVLRKWHIADKAAWAAAFTPAFDDDCF